MAIGIAAPGPAVPSPVMATCCICCDDKPVAEGLFCDPGYVAVAGRTPAGVTHFVCGSGEGSCLELYLLVKSEGGAGGVDMEGALRCPGHACPRELRPHPLAARVSEGAFAAYDGARHRRTARLAYEDAQQGVAALRTRTEARVEGAALGAAAVEEAQAVAATAAARHVQDELLTLRCPNGHAFFDITFTECFSVQCATCGIRFCAWCLGGATGDRNASHAHVGRCAANANPPYADGRKNLFGTRAQFDEAHRVRRRESLAAYLKRLRGGPIVRCLAVQLLARDLADLGIELPADVAAGEGYSWRDNMISVAPDGTVREPASGAFDVTIKPGEPVQAAVDACPPGGCVLLLPGLHDGPLALPPGKEVHVFGRGLAKLRTRMGEVVTSESDVATIDGLIIRREAGGDSKDYGVWIKGGRLRLQACDITSASLACVAFSGGADPTVALCKCVGVVLRAILARILDC